MHILKISTLVISLLNTKFMPCFFPCKHKKTHPVHKELGEGKGITIVIKKVFLLHLYHHLLFDIDTSAYLLFGITMRSIPYCADVA